MAETPTVAPIEVQTVADLIEALKRFPPDAFLAYGDGYSSNYHRHSHGAFRVSAVTSRHYDAEAGESGSYVHVWLRHGCARLGSGYFPSTPEGR